MNLGELSEKMKSLNNWGLEGNAIQKEIEFKDFKEAIGFVDKVAEAAEKHQHHPDILINYNRVRLILTTHDAKGLTDKDFEVAQEIDKIEIKPE